MKIDLPIREEMKDERYLEIRSYDRNGNGSSFRYAVTKDTENHDIFSMAGEVWTSEMNKRQENYDCSYIKIGVYQPKWKATVDVVEVNRIIYELSRPLKSGRTYSSDWKTKRKGLKFKLELRTVKAKFTNGVTATSRWYRKKD